jgi:hypothetical protein
MRLEVRVRGGIKLYSYARLYRTITMQLSESFTAQVLRRYLQDNMWSIFEDFEIVPDVLLFEAG